MLTPKVVLAEKRKISAEGNQLFCIGYDSGTNGQYKDNHKYKKKDQHVHGR